ncbi:MAG: YbjN domain-containing protein [Deltaproteobacteria bacterium]|nr:YbjN domain-containing protein [Deltaproteobacteria bacterium]
MIDAYLARFAELTGAPIEPLDATGYTQIKRGSAHIGVNVLEDNGVLMLLAPIMDVTEVPAEGRERFYRKLLELSFLATSDASFAIDGKKDLVYVRALRRLSALDYEELEDLLQTVGTIADEWDDELKREFG